MDKLYVACNRERATEDVKLKLKLLLVTGPVQSAHDEGWLH